MTEEILKYLKQMVRKGIGFYAQQTVFSMVDLAPDEVPIFMSDEDAFWARRLDITKEHYVDWRRWLQNERQCEATTARGKRCNNWVECPDSPKDYAFGAPVYCRTHILRDG